MKHALRSLALAAAVLCSGSVLHAQADTVVYGRTTISFSTSFLQTIQGLATITDLDGHPLLNNSIILKIDSGVIQLQTSASELHHAAGFIATGGNTTIRIQDLIVNAVNPYQPIVTGLITYNNTFMGRMTIFGVFPPSTFRLPLVPTDSALQENNLTLQLTPAFATALNQMFSSNVAPANAVVGTASIYAVLAANAQSSK